MKGNIEHPLTIALIEHDETVCPAEHADQADKVVPALREATAAGQVPEAFAFSSKDHGGVFAAEGTKTEIGENLPAVPLHEVTLENATGDEEVYRIVRNPGSLATEEGRRAFIEHAESRYFPGRFPNLHDGPVPSGAELADFIAAKHE